MDTRKTSIFLRFSYLISTFTISLQSPHRSTFSSLQGLFQLVFRLLTSPVGALRLSFRFSRRSFDACMLAFWVSGRSFDAPGTLQDAPNALQRRSGDAQRTLETAARSKKLFRDGLSLKKLVRDVEALEKTFKKGASGRLNCFGTAKRLFLLTWD